jgi:chromosome segregation ATPase
MAPSQGEKPSWFALELVKLGLQKEAEWKPANSTENWVQFPSVSFHYWITKKEQSCTGHDFEKLQKTVVELKKVLTKKNSQLDEAHRKYADLSSRYSALLPIVDAMKNQRAAYGRLKAYTEKIKSQNARKVAAARQSALEERDLEVASLSSRLSSLSSLSSQRSDTSARIIAELNAKVQRLKSQVENLSGRVKGAQQTVEKTNTYHEQRAATTQSYISKLKEQLDKARRAESKAYEEMQKTKRQVVGPVRDFDKGDWSTPVPGQARVWKLHAEEIARLENEHEKKLKAVVYGDSESRFDLFDDWDDERFG